MSQKTVLVVIGSESDERYLQGCCQLLEEFGIGYDLVVASAHRQPDRTAKLAQEAARRGFLVIIAAAGFAAHLPGTLAAHTSLPVIGVPLPTSHLKGTDSLLSILQMPSGVPVATMSVGEAGAKNAAILAAQMLALSDAKLKRRLGKFKRGLSK
jgi:phosphoribosylaminoimidazole carboxylase PurE protein